MGNLNEKDEKKYFGYLSGMSFDDSFYIIVTDMSTLMESRIP